MNNFSVPFAFSVVRNCCGLCKLAFVSAVLLFAPESLFAQEPLRAGTIFSATQAPLWAAKEGRYFEKYGIRNLEVIQFSGGQPVTRALIGGDIQISTTGGAAVVNARLKGADTVIIARTVGVFPYTLYVSKDIRDASELKGKKLAVSTVGGSGYVAMQYALRKLGLDPDKDVAMLQVGDFGTRLASLASGTVQGTLLLPPFTLRAREFGTKVLGKNLRETDGKILQETYDFWLKVFPKVPNPGPEDATVFVEFMQVKEPRDWREFVDTSVMDDLEREGFLTAGLMIVLTIPLSSAAVFAQDLAKAKQEGRIVFYTSWGPSDADYVVKAFEKKYPPLKVETVRSSSERTLTRLLSEHRANTFLGDVVAISGIQSGILKEKGSLDRYQSSESVNFPADWRDPDGFAMGLHQTIYVIGYNTKLVSADVAPKSYEDLLQPRWKGQLGWDMEEYYLFGALIKARGKDKGMDFWRRLVEQQINFRKGYTLISELVSAGEFPVAVSASRR